MRRPLFWKILAAAWASLILISIGNAFVFRLFVEAARPWGEQMLERVGHADLAAAAQVLQSNGPSGVAVFAAQLRPGERLSIDPDQTAPPVAPLRDEFRLTRVVATPAGAYRLTYSAERDSFFRPLPQSVNVPLGLLAVNFLAVTVFSILITWYLVGPIQTLRSGLQRVADGDLSVRLHDQIARRRDEMADLAQSFDLMAARLQQLLDARERLLHDVSHEFRSPLTRLLLAVELARQNPERSRTSLDRIETEAGRLNEMVGELLSLSRAEFSAAQSESYFALVDLLAAVVEDAAFEADGKGVAVKAEFDLCGGEGPIINGSAELLRKAVDNVLRNAVRFSRAGQTVTVRLVQQTSACGDRPRIEIADQGPGVPEADLERIFEPFVRLDGQPPSGGVGLGLAIARSAAQAHQGAVWAANQPGGGLTVVLELRSAIPAAHGLGN